MAVSDGIVHSGRNCQRKGDRIVLNVTEVHQVPVVTNIWIEVARRLRSRRGTPSVISLVGAYKRPLVRHSLVASGKCATDAYHWRRMYKG